MLLKNMLIECNAIQFGEFTLTSGKKSNYYIDIKRASTNPAILKEIAMGMAPHIDGDRIAGMELGAVPIAAAVALETGKPFVIIRKGKREHGTGNQIEGELNKGERVVVVEDVATTGGSVVKSIEILRSAGAVVEKVVVVVDREEGARENLEPLGVELVALVKKGEFA